MEGYYERRKTGQGRWLGKLKETIDEVSATPEFKENAGDKPIGLTEVPFFDVELVGVPALYYLGSQCFTENPSFSHLVDNDNSDKPKVLICGGKGGVGKSLRALVRNLIVAMSWFLNSVPKCCMNGYIRENNNKLFSCRFHGSYGA